MPLAVVAGCRSSLAVDPLDCCFAAGMAAGQANRQVRLARAPRHEGDGAPVMLRHGLQKVNDVAFSSQSWRFTMLTVYLVKLGRGPQVAASAKLLVMSALGPKSVAKPTPQHTPSHKKLGRSRLGIESYRMTIMSFSPKIAWQLRMHGASSVSSNSVLCKHNHQKHNDGNVARVKAAAVNASTLQFAPSSLM
jgi:hypothetical protein